MWPYKSRLAIGMKFSDFAAIKSKTFRFEVDEVMYEIDRDKALALGKRYTLAYGRLPNIIPLEEFTELKPNNNEQIQLFEGDANEPRLSE